MLMRAVGPNQERGEVAPGADRRREGVTLTELLVVISIMIILMAIMASALGAFTHTSRVDAAADTVATALREARYHAMSKNVSVLPVFLRDRKGKQTIVYAAKALSYRGNLAASGATVTDDGQSAPIPWTMTREAIDSANFKQGAFVYMVGTNTLDLDGSMPSVDKDGNPTPGSAQAYYEMMYIRVTVDGDYPNDSSRWKYEILGRGVHNTAFGTFNYQTTNYGGADGYVVVSSGINTNYAFADEDEAREFTLSGFALPDHIVVDQAPALDKPSDYDSRVMGTLTAQAGMFHERALVSGGGFGVHMPADWYPIFLPIFQPDGRVTSGRSRSSLGSLDVPGGARYGMYDLTLRVLDTVSREARFVTVRLASGQVFVSLKVPPRNTTGTSSEDSGDPGVPDYDEVYDPSGTSSTSSSSSSSSNTSSTSNSSTNSNTSTNSSTNSSTSSTGTASSNSTSNTASNSNSTSTNSNSNSTNNTATNSNSTSNSSSSNSTASTGTASTASTSNSASSNTSNTSNNSTNSTNNTSTASSSATTSGAPSSSGQTSTASGASGGGKF
ncbi:MAG: prepilin-type N-terminal cleavage/methylation domain-containing protein [Planctomycetota bacterium]|nr:prepilin-type N-terminal cleavage/methylation domain-containing protein [Planctomycetota bacterium]